MFITMSTSRGIENNILALGSFGPGGGTCTGSSTASPLIIGFIVETLKGVFAILCEQLIEHTDAQAREYALHMLLDQ